MNRRVAARYATALMDLGEELKQLDKIAEDLRDIATTMHNSRELRVALMSPVVNQDRKGKIVMELFGKRFSAVTMKFMELLIQKGRAEFLLGTAEEFLRMLDEKRNILHAQVHSAVTLTEAEQMQIQAMLERMTSKRIKSEFLTDADLRGGFTARIGDQMIDASLRHQLETLREQFKTGGAPVLN